MEQRYTKLKGFTLIELSIVVVIIGLIVAGVVAGQSLVKQAKLRTLISDINKYEVAFNTFKLQYNAIPGDMSDAASYWGGATTNGNGNQQVIEGAGNEFRIYWQHLALAGLVPGTFNSAHQGATAFAVGVTSPPTSISGATWAVWYPHAGIPTIHGKVGNFLQLGKPATNLIYEEVLTGREAQQIDQKLDDGLAATGRLLPADMLTVGSCHTGAVTSTTSTYVINSDTISCALVYFLD